MLRDPGALERAGRAGADYARAHFTPMSVAKRFEAVLEEVMPSAGPH